MYYLKEEEALASFEIITFRDFSVFTVMFFNIRSQPAAESRTMRKAVEKLIAGSTLII